MFDKSTIKEIKEISVVIEVPKSEKIDKALTDNGFKFAYEEGAYWIYDYDSYAALLDLFETLE